MVLFCALLYIKKKRRAVPLSTSLPRVGMKSASSRWPTEAAALVLLSLSSGTAVKFAPASAQRAPVGQSPSTAHGSGEASHWSAASHPVHRPGSRTL